MFSDIKMEIFAFPDVLSNTNWEMYLSRSPSTHLLRILTGLPRVRKQLSGCLESSEKHRNALTPLVKNAILTGKCT